MTIKVSMYPHVDELQPLPTAGISRVVKEYFKHLPNFGIEMLPQGSDEADLVAIHAAAMTSLPLNTPVVSHCHGLYFTADSNLGGWTYEVNQAVIGILRHASAVTVPSDWVAQTIRRDMHFNPIVIPHGVDWQEWQEGQEDLGYVLWNKNRKSDACDPTPVNELAVRAPSVRFLTTHAAPNPRPNIRVTDTVDFATMKDMILKCSVYLATTKETFGIGTLEAMAAAKPILGFDYGGTADLVKHGYNGYLARPGDYEDLAQGLDYCRKHAKVLGHNAALVAKHYTWETAAEMVVREVYRPTIEKDDAKDHRVTVVIPMYNKAATVRRAIMSAVRQIYKPHEIIVVNNNSSDDFVAQVEIAETEARDAGIGFRLVNCERQGVAHARNYGIAMAETEYVCCLDADDEILPEFLEVCRDALIKDRSLGIAYTSMTAVDQGGRERQSQWPGEYHFDQVLRGRNQVPTCCVFKREAWQRAGGYRQRYAPLGAGSEDADLWLRIGLLGYGGQRATNRPLFRYYLGGYVSGNPDYREKDWRGDKGYLNDQGFPFAATFTPSNKLSHPVRQYDEPLISVIIPVAQDHVGTLWDAIDSVESQTFRRWELIVINDGYTGLQVDALEDEWNRLKQAFPFVRFRVTHNGPRGAGYARNLGAALAKAPLLLFLDADDWLTPTALEDMLGAYEENPDQIIYADYIGHAYIEDVAVLTRLKQAQRLLDYNEKTREATVLYYASNYDCDLAQSQPVVGKDPYIWNVISSLIPKAFHDEIGGFDESMKSWEDWDYWVRLAKAGKCFYHLNKPLMEYRFYTGKRRSLANPYESGESGRQLSAHLLEYMRDKYERIENMPCSSCGGRRRSTPSMEFVMAKMQSEATMSNVSSTDMIEVELADGNVGDHLIAFQGRSYGYRVHGERFQMLAAHARLDRRVRIVGATPQPAVVSQKKAEVPPPPTPAAGSQPKNVQQEVAALKGAAGKPAAAPGDVTISSDSGFDLSVLWGIDENRAVRLKEMGVRTAAGVSVMTPETLEKMFDIPSITARRIVSEAEKYVNAQAEKAKKK